MRSACNTTRRRLGLGPYWKLSYPQLAVRVPAPTAVEDRRTIPDGRKYLHFSTGMRNFTPCVLYVSVYTKSNTYRRSEHGEHKLGGLEGLQYARDHLVVAGHGHVGLEGHVRARALWSYVDGHVAALRRI